MYGWNYGPGGEAFFLYGYAGDPRVCDDLAQLPRQHGIELPSYCAAYASRLCRGLEVRVVEDSAAAMRQLPPWSAL